MNEGARAPSEAEVRANSAGDPLLDEVSRWLGQVHAYRKTRLLEFPHLRDPGFDRSDERLWGKAFEEVVRLEELYGPRCWQAEQLIARTNDTILRRWETRFLAGTPRSRRRHAREGRSPSSDRD